MTDLQTTHAPDCWGWGPRHYECAVGQIERDVRPCDPSFQYPFHDLDSSEDSESVYAYFVFIRED